MSESSTALDAVAALMRERQKYESWLEALEARRAGSPAHVFERVKGDYERRLREVVGQLGEHSPALEQQAQTLDGQVAALAEQEREQRDRRAEAELRSHVGELSMEEWERLARESDERLAALAADQDRLRAELGQVRELLTAATTPPRSLTPVASPTETAVAAPPAPAQTEPPHADSFVQAEPFADHVDAALAEHAEAEAPRAEQSPFDELAFLESVAAEPPAVEQAAAHAPEPAAAPRPVDPSLGIEVHDAQSSNPLAGALRTSGAPLAGNVTAAQPIVLRNDAPAAKTLKCNDCGSMNLPTEWYCERCGAELAAL